MEKDLPEDIPHVFISSVTGQGIVALKDMLWQAITDESNRIEPTTITHRPLDGHHRVREEDEFIFENVPTMSDDEDEEFFDEEWDDEIEYDWDDDIDPKEYE
jgi:GTP-binding protein